MAFQYLGPFAKLVSPYGGGFLLLNLIDCRHGEIKTDIGTYVPFTNYYYTKDFSDEHAIFPPALLQRIQQFANRLVVASDDIVWLIVEDNLAERPYHRPEYIKENYDGSIFRSQATMKPDSSQDFGPNVIHGVPATLDTLQQRGLL